ncbi:hypothetical protein ACQPZF_27340 [Actinosynnema sp. CS-041913]|uniref:hypothetical protein n=1 Tax=Actinosynnema sp. CS-041913 TaxID=3239917 RepID=UPI003D8D18CF
MPEDTLSEASTDPASGFPAGVLFDRSEDSLLVGGPGAGKSSLLRSAVTFLVERWLRGETPPAPVRVLATDFVASSPLPEAIAASVRANLSALGLLHSWPPGFFAEPPIPGGSWLVPVDGLDEVIDHEQRKAILTKLAGSRAGNPEGLYRFAVVQHHGGVPCDIFGVRHALTADGGSNRRPVGRPPPPDASRARGRATGIHLVPEAVHPAAAVGNRFFPLQVESRSQFEEQPVSGKPGGVAGRVGRPGRCHAPHEQSCLEALELAQTRTLAAPEVTRSVVVGSGQDQMTLWRHAFARIDQASFRATGALSLSTVTLRRYDLATLCVWSVEATVFTRNGAMNCSESPVAGVVGGTCGAAGPGVTVRTHRTPPEWEAEARVGWSELDTPSGTSSIVAQVGLADQRLNTAYDTMVEVIGSAGVSRADLEPLLSWWCRTRRSSSSA